MRVCGLWFGGSSYAAPDPDKPEQFGSLADARTTFENRFHDSFYPCVDDDAVMHVYIGTTATDYPDRIIRRGKRGGIIVERA